ncbi:TrkH family potassium uptake protein [Desulfosporosinus youngiae]|uniref:Trk-type K+ transport system, membrane component n=1 Tax=Desulfosporosinus youngiae DSM 17734 TaxID=768710 RepID=H5XW24_9FIRM|nr:TrkH family potassium uptake protein [Desulfosporosinus youngiae]EHQ90476.1 Trk-type K+ transport system, membrane component [Desulfosporosinus youngiae DSM 17734]
MNFRLIENVLGRLLLGYAAFMGIPFLYALLRNEPTSWPFLITILLTLVISLVFISHGQEDRLGIREGFTIVSGAWILTSLLGALPFYLSNSVPTYLDGLFETVSGLTTTGSSVIDNLEVLSQSLLLWRSLTHWLGGMGIIVLFIVFLPKIGAGAVHMFNAEVPGPTAEKVLPRIRDNAARLWQMYVGFTLLQIILLWLAGMSWFDSVNHSFATMATGGFSTKNTSIMFYNSPLIEFILIVFMILAGGNFGLYFIAWGRGLKHIWKDTEFRVYLSIIAASTLVIALSLWLQGGKEILFSVRHALFQVSTIITTTGFASDNFDQWPSVTKMVLLLLMLIGGSAGSTAGGIKVARIMLLMKLVRAELRRAIHPRAVTAISSGGKQLDPLMLNTVAVFFFLFIAIFTAATILLSATGLPPFDAMSAVAATLGNVGPGFGLVGPTTTFSSINAFGELVLILCMLLGRLELFTLLVVLQPEFWRSRKSW